MTSRVQVAHAYTAGGVHVVFFLSFFLVFFFFFFSHTSTLHLLDKPWSQVSFLLPPGSYLQFLYRA